MHEKRFGGEYGAVVNGKGGVAPDTKVAKAQDYFDPKTLDLGNLISKGETVIMSTGVKALGYTKRGHRKDH